ncbi:DUF418 domain-containing protein [Glaciecola sp. SC05]|uniref:DUF418 domain-containing protein n=1 Tax=Glaciecola sp. SC05 TaxID=1987355 RepID=UPI00352832CC
MNKPSLAANDAAPISTSTRYDILDALRGFALFGIFYANVQFFSGWLFVDSEAKTSIAGANIYDAFLLMIIDGRFYTIFSFLFGLGFALQLSRLQTKVAAKANLLYLRRLSILLLISLIHMCLFWIGDILLLYALLGFVLFFMRKCNDRSLLVIAAILFVVPIPGYYLFWKLGIDPSLGLYQVSSYLVNGSDNISGFFAGFYETVHTTSIVRYFELNLEIAIGRLGYYFDTWRIPKVLGIMLIGMWAGRQLIAGKLLENTVLLKKTILFGLILGLPLTVIYANLSGLNSFQAHSADGFLSVIAYMLAVFPLAFAYIAIFTLLWRKYPSILSVFTAPGRMALSNYLLQTFLGISIFYGIGFGIHLQGAPWSLVVVTILVFTLQVVLSNMWLKVFMYGPSEWIWRMLTYGKRLPIKR